MEWPRTPAGTLRCPCGKTGTIFVQVEPGQLGGYCGDECYEIGKAFDHPVPPEDAPAPPDDGRLLF